MATLTQSVQTLSLRDVLVGPFNAIGRFLMAATNAQRISKEAEYLLSLSDAQLAERGLTREDLPQYLMRDYMHI